MAEISALSSNSLCMSLSIKILDEYKKLKENSVSKEKYEKDMAVLKEKNEMYLKAITEGSKVDLPNSDSKSLQETIADLSKFKGTNLEYWQKTNAAIDKILKEVPEQEIIRVTGSEGLDELIKVNEGMKKMVEDAHGDPDYFRTLYGNRVKDSATRISSEIEKAGNLFSYLEKKN